MNKTEIEAEAQALVNRHLAEMEQAKKDLANTMLEAGYDPDEWIIVDNFLDIQQGKTYTYECFAKRREDL